MLGFFPENSELDQIIGIWNYLPNTVGTYKYVSGGSSLYWILRRDKRLSQVQMKILHLQSCLKWILITLEIFKCTDSRLLWCAISYSRKERPQTNEEDFLTSCVDPFFFLDVWFFFKIVNGINKRKNMPTVILAKLFHCLKFLLSFSCFKSLLVLDFFHV